MTKDEVFKKQAEKGLICLNDNCEKREHCLRWQLREYVAKNRMTLTCINPRHKDVAKGKCPLYLDDKKIRMAGQLIAAYGRTIYYEYRNGKRLISPQKQAFIREVCQQCGWMKEPHYDGFVEDYLWG